MMESPPNHSRWFELIILLAGSALLFLGRLDTALLEPEEIRYAEISRQMFVANEWIVPVYHGQAYYDKPPLLYWLVMTSYSIFGVHDWAARLVPGICGVLSVLVVYGWGCRAYGRRAGFLGALILVLSARFIYLGRFVATDAPLSLCVLGALACTHLAVRGPRLRWLPWIGGGLACGLGLLAKGPTIFVLVGVPAVIYLIIDRTAVRPGWKAYAAYFATVLVIAVPWYVAVTLRDPQFAEYFFWKHHVLRYVSPFDHLKPFWFYLPDFLAGTLPWSILLLPIGVQLWRDRRLNWMRQAPDYVFPLLAAIWCLVFFSASGSKRVGYVLPAFAPLTIAFGIYVDRWLSNREVDSSLFDLAKILSITALAIGMAGVAGLAAFHYCSVPVAIVAGMALGGLSIAILLKRRSFTSQAGLWACCIIVFLECSVGINWVLPEYAERFSLRSEMQHIQSEVHPDDCIVCFPRHSDSVNFYLNRDDAAVFGEERREAALAYINSQPTIWLIARDGEATRRLLAGLPTSAHAQERIRQGSTVVYRISRNNPHAVAANAP